jgi:hypothetical protein
VWLFLTVAYPGVRYKPVLVRRTEMEQEKTPRSESEDSGFVGSQV